jgi:hypothetical protein
MVLAKNPDRPSGNVPFLTHRGCNFSSLHLSDAPTLGFGLEGQMARQVFFSFHFDNDIWRASQVRNMGAIEGNKPVSDNDWEAVKKSGDAAIEKWIDDQISGKSCAVVLVGSQTAERKWVIREIVKAWDKGKGVVGIRIHNLKDASERTSVAGENPFFRIKYGETGKKLAAIVKLYDPSGADSNAVYATIKNNIDGWVEEAIKIRTNN